MSLNVKACSSMFTSKFCREILCLHLCVCISFDLLIQFGYLDIGCSRHI